MSVAPRGRITTRSSKIHFVHAHPLGTTTERPAPEIHLYRHRLRVEVETVVGRIGTCDVVVKSRLRDERAVYAR